MGMERNRVTTISQDIQHTRVLQTFQMTIIAHYKTHQPKTIQSRIMEGMANLKEYSTSVTEMLNSSIALLERNMSLGEMWISWRHFCDPMGEKKFFHKNVSAIAHLHMRP